MFSILSFNELCWEKGHGSLYKAQQWKKEDSERLGGEGNKIKFIDLRFERGHVLGFRKGRRKQDVP